MSDMSEFVCPYCKAPDQEPEDLGDHPHYLTGECTECGRQFSVNTAREEYSDDKGNVFPDPPRNPNSKTGDEFIGKDAIAGPLCVHKQRQLDKLDGGPHPALRHILSIAVCVPCGVEKEEK